jgi:hypothetical protein
MVQKMNATRRARIPNIDATASENERRIQNTESVARRARISCGLRGARGLFESRRVNPRRESIPDFV